MLWKLTSVTFNFGTLMVFLNFSRSNTVMPRTVDGGNRSGQSMILWRHRVAPNIPLWLTSENSFVLVDIILITFISICTAEPFDWFWCCLVNAYSIMLNESYLFACFEVIYLDINAVPIQLKGYWQVSSRVYVWILSRTFSPTDDVLYFVVDSDVLACGDRNQLHSNWIVKYIWHRECCFLPDTPCCRVCLVELFSWLVTKTKHMDFGKNILEKYGWKEGWFAIFILFDGFQSDALPFCKNNNVYSLLFLFILKFCALISRRRNR